MTVQRWEITWYPTGRNKTSRPVPEVCDREGCDKPVARVDTAGRLLREGMRAGIALHVEESYYCKDHFIRAGGVLRIGGPRHLDYGKHTKKVYRRGLAKIDGVWVEGERGKGRTAEDVESPIVPEAGFTTIEREVYGRELNRLLDRLPQPHEKVMRLIRKGVMKKDVAEKFEKSPSWVTGVYRESIEMMCNMRAKDKQRAEAEAERYERLRDKLQRLKKQRQE